MNRLQGYVLTLAVLAGVEVLPGRAAAQPSWPDVRRVRESQPVTVNGARFVALAETDWRQAKPSGKTPMVADVVLQLHITNLNKDAVLFPTQGTFGVKLWGPDGKE